MAPRPTRSPTLDELGSLQPRKRQRVADQPDLLSAKGLPGSPELDADAVRSLASSLSTGVSEWTLPSNAPPEMKSADGGAIAWPSFPADDPPDQQLRIYSWNINGIGPFVQPSIGSFIAAPLPLTTALPGQLASGSFTAPPITTSLRNFLRRHNWPHIFHIQELKINPADEKTRAAAESAVNLCRSGPDDGPTYRLEFCLPTDRFNANGFGRKMYGVATAIREDFYCDHIARVRTVDWDTEGRCLVLETHNRLAIWNIFAPIGAQNPYKNPETGAVMGTRHDRKTAFHESLRQECADLEKDGWRLVICGDLNVVVAAVDALPSLRTRPEPVVRHRTDFVSKFLEDSVKSGGLRLVDTFRHLHPTRKRYTCLPRHVEWRTVGERVDYILLSRELAEQEGVLVAAEVLMSETERGPSDHVPVYLELDMSKTD